MLRKTVKSKRTGRKQKKATRGRRTLRLKMQMGGRNIPSQQHHQVDPNTVPIQVPPPIVQQLVPIPGPIADEIKEQIEYEFGLIIADLHTLLFEDGSPSEETLEVRRKIVTIMNASVSNYFTQHFSDLEDTYISDNEEIQNVFKDAYCMIYNFHHVFNIDYEDDLEFPNYAFYVDYILMPMIKSGFLSSSLPPSSPLLRPILFEIDRIGFIQSNAVITVHSIVRDYILSQLPNPSLNNSEINVLEIPEDVARLLRKLRRLLNIIPIGPVQNILDDYI